MDILQIPYRVCPVYESYVNVVNIHKYEVIMLYMHSCIYNVCMLSSITIYIWPYGLHASIYGMDILKIPYRVCP